MKRSRLLIVVILAAAALIAACAVLPGAAPTPVPATLLPPTLAPATFPPTSVPPSPTAVPVRTDTPAAPAALALCPITATRTPPPGAPTYIPGGPNPPRGPVDPHIEVCGSADTVHVGETVTISARSIDVGLPYFMLRVKDDEQSNYTQIVQVTYDNRIQGPTQATARLELVSAKGSMYEATFVLRALRAGAATVVVSATGEIHYGYPGPATFAGASSDPAMIKVVDR